MKSKNFTPLLLLFLIVPLLSISARESSRESSKEVKPFGLDAGLILSTGYLDSDDPTYSGLSLIFLLRGGLTVTGRYRINDKISAGAELGFNYMSISTSDGGSNTTFVDIPFNAVFRYGGKKTFIEPHIGYYISASVPEFSGFSVGAKGSLAGLYVDFTYVIGSDYKYPRFGLGWQYNNIF